MYTEKRNPGKFEACESALMAEILSQCNMDDEIGTVMEGEWYGLIRGKSYWFIVEEDSQGFVQYRAGKPQEIKHAWDEIVGTFTEEEGNDE